MRILHLCNECDEAGNGIVNMAVDLACLQSRTGHIVHFASSGGSFVSLLEENGVKHHLINQKWRDVTRFVRDLFRLRPLISDIKPDIIHSHMMTGALIGWLGRVFRLYGGFHLVTTIHNEWRRAANLMAFSDRVIVVSRAGRQLALRRGIPDRKIRIVRNGPLASPRHLARQKQSDRPREITITTVAGLYRRKGIQDLIAAFDQIADEFPGSSLCIVGQGPHRKYLEALIASTKCSSRIHLTGFVKDPFLIMDRSEIFVLASHVETFGLVIAEAREAGCAIIATDVGGVSEVLDDGAAGQLLQPREPDLLAAALRRLLTDQDELDLWRDRATKNLDWLSCHRMSAEVLTVYSDVLQDPPNRRSNRFARIVTRARGEEAATS